jgi:glycylpeptide N-tetradecanoyltransferase
MIQAGFDVFNCLDLGNNSDFLEQLIFGKGSGSLNYYMFNYRLKQMDPKMIDLVLL